MYCNNPEAPLYSLSVSEFVELLKRHASTTVQKLDNPLPDKIGIMEACQITGLAKSTVYILVYKRKIPHYKQGKLLRFSRKELNEWIESGKRSAR